MSAPVLADDGSGRALIFDRETGEVIRCSVPTAIENVRHGAGRFVHGDTGELLKAAKPVRVAAEPAIPLTEPDVLPLPEAEQPPAPVAQDAGPNPDPLDHDGDGRKGGSKKAADPERAAVIAALKAAKIRYFAGAPTAKLKALLPG